MQIHSRMIACCNAAWKDRRSPRGACASKRGRHKIGIAPIDEACVPTVPGGGDTLLGVSAPEISHGGRCGEVAAEGSLGRQPWGWAAWEAAAWAAARTRPLRKQACRAQTPERAGDALVMHSRGASRPRLPGPALAAALNASHRSVLTHNLTHNALVARCTLALCGVAWHCCPVVCPCSVPAARRANPVCFVVLCRVRIAGSNLIEDLKPLTGLT